MSIKENLMSIGIGGLTGLADSMQDKGWYIPQFQYAGNGLAKNSMQFLANPDYRDYTSGGRALASLFGGDNSNEEGITPSKLFNNLFNTEKASFPLKTTTYNLPQVGNVGGGTIGDYGNAYNSFYSYNLPTQQTSFKKFWE